MQTSSDRFCRVVRSEKRRSGRLCEVLEARHALASDGLPEVDLTPAEASSPVFATALEPQISTETDDQGRTVYETYLTDSDGDADYDLRQSVEYEYAEGLISSSVVTEDRGLDGVVDSRSTTRYVYNALGAMTSYAFTLDASADGSIDQRYDLEITYDDRGNLLRSTSKEDTDGDGVVDATGLVVNQYHGNGNIASTEFTSDRNADGIPEVRSTDRYDERGNYLSSVYTQDTDTDGVVDLISSTTQEYNDNGQVRSILFATDNNGDGLADLRSSQTYAYDEAGNAVSLTTEVDSNGDGIPDETYVTDLNGSTTDSSIGPATDAESGESDISSADIRTEAGPGEGVVEEIAYDLNPVPPGTPATSEEGTSDSTPPVAVPSRETLYASTLDDLNRLVSETYSVDTNGDLAYDVSYLNEYEYDDAQMRVVRTSEDRGLDGIVDSRSTTTFTFDDLGLLVAYNLAIDSNADGAIDQSYGETLDYSEQGLFLGSVSSEDTDGDGVPNLIRTSAIKYNDNGSIASAVATVDNDGDGIVDYRSTDTYAYDSEGNALSFTSEIDSNGDGTVDESYVTDLTAFYGYSDNSLASDASGDLATRETASESDPPSTDSETSVMGDVNGDQAFDSSDVVLLFQDGKYGDDVADNADWNSGDWNGDRDFDSADLVLAMQHGHYRSDPRDGLLTRESESQAVDDPSGFAGDGSLIDWSTAVDGYWAVNEASEDGDPQA
jgi:hypothetical protein